VDPGAGHPSSVGVGFERRAIGDDLRIVVGIVGIDQVEIEKEGLLLVRLQPGLGARGDALGVRNIDADTPAGNRRSRNPGRSRCPRARCSWRRNRRCDSPAATASRRAFRISGGSAKPLGRPLRISPGSRLVRKEITGRHGPGRLRVSGVDDRAALGEEALGYWARYRARSHTPEDDRRAGCRREEENVRGRSRSVVARAASTTGPQAITGSSRLARRARRARRAGR
jgi:hypothetical protein